MLSPRRPIGRCSKVGTCDPIDTRPHPWPSPSPSLYRHIYRLHFLYSHGPGIPTYHYRYLQLSVSFSDRQSQTILVSGESGSGKTESCKLILEYITAVSSSDGDDSNMVVADKVLKSNPLLEAFGNAKTARNNNSSRFGKYLELQFSAQDERIVGAKVDTYLLEKSRVVHQTPVDRNFHVFYQLLRGADDACKERLHLTSPESQYRYLSGGDLRPVEDIDDVADFAETIQAMELLGMNSEDRDAVFRVLAAILHLGNIVFVTKKSGDEEEAEAAECADTGDDSPLAHAAALLQVDADALHQAMCTRKLTINGESVTRKFNVENASNARDALAKAIYQRLFQHIVEQINSQTHAPRSSVISPVTIGLLDIFGFEIFDNNAFEQLNINYANEKLQQLFNKYIFKIEQSEYKREGISWEHIDFTDNIEALSLIEKSPGGIIALLDEECKMQKGTDEQFANRLHSTNPDNPYLKRYPNPVNCFAVQHYAGEVIYTANGCVEKNRDPLHADLLPVMEASTFALLTTLFPPSATADGEGPAQKIFSKSVASQFKTQVSDLMTKIAATHPHFVRCINSNSDKRPATFFGSEVVTQLRYGGVVEAVRIMKHMYPTRVDHLMFYNKYASDQVWQCILASKPGAPFKVLGPESTIEHSRDACTALCKALELENISSYQIGRSKVFFRFGEVAKIDRRRQEYLDNSATKIRALFLRHKAQAAFQEAQRRQRAATLIQKFYRACRRISGFRNIVFLARREQLRLRNEAEREARRQAASLVIQTRYRGYVSHRDYKTLRNGIIKLQAARRGALCRHTLKINKVESMFDAKTRLKNELEAVRKKLRIEMGAKEALATELTALREEHEKLQKDYQQVSGKCERAAAQVASAAQLFSSLERQKVVLERQVEELETLNNTLISQSDGGMATEDEMLALRGSVGRPSDVGSGGAGGSSVSLTSEDDINTIVARDGMKRSGWLTKQGAKTKSWKKRWFVLNGIGLSYYKSEKDKKPIDTIKFVDHIMVPVKDMKETSFPKQVTVPEQCMKLFPRGDGRVWYLFTDSIKETEDWLSSLDVNKSIGTYLKKALVSKRKPDQRVLSCITDLLARVLFLDNLPLSLESCVALAQPLSHYQRLHTLSMHNAHLQSKHIDVLCKALSAHPSIKKLRLSKNELGDAGMHSLCKALHDNTTITQLYLDHNRIGDKGAEEICGLIHAESSLAVLSLEGNDIGDEGCSKIAEKLQEVKTFPMSTLALQANKIGDAGASAIATMLQDAECLESVQLSHNQIGDAGAGALASALAHNTTILHLNLDANQLSQKGVQSMADMLVTNQCLLDISLGLSSLNSSQFSQTLGEKQFSLEVLFPQMTLKRRAAFRVSDA
eukprot:TRINITY_DN4092_c0_g1_i1.p1 TRINITY_DN4092_c0_g1~~TRINITY_DN4092_c0_g1_i1.p1  ORF type:complete len:1363 (+),score=391.36 TRINITY_DN4092_c0_g1_i1:958-5046(+)